MKKIFKTFILLAAIICCANFVLTAKKAEAITIGTVPLQVVDDLDNTPYPVMTTLFYNYNDANYSQFTIESAGEVKAIYHCEVDSNSSGNAWISTDADGNDIIGNISTFAGSETDLSWYLESGTYYLFSTWDTHPFKVNVALLFEKAKADEPDTATSFINSNALNLKETVRGFLSYINPNDYYAFQLTEKATVTLKYSFDASAASGEGVGYCTLYDANELFLKEGTYTKSDKGSKEITYLLEPGTYFVKLHGFLGNTTLCVSPMYYNISLTPDTDNSWTKKHIHINIDTSIDYSDITVLYKDVKESLLNNNSVWSKTNNAYIVLDGETFEASKSGTYSVRITDQYGNNTMQKIEVSNIDITKPVIKGVKDGKSYRKSVTLTWSDTQSGINTGKTTLNGKAVSSGIIVTKEGKYTLKVYDIVGNYKAVVFYVDDTAPTAGVDNGKTYNDSITLKFKDAVSGIKKITVDDTEVSATSTTYYCYLDGEYTVELWDKAGNYRKIVFSIKK